jgi:predicted enzyme related to lactoylglutathione lyase
MFAKIRHVAMYTHNHSAVSNFYQTVFGMKRMTTGTVDETGKQNPNRGHISDGVIGLAVLPRYAGIQSGMDHYGFAVEDLKVSRAHGEILSGHDDRQSPRIRSLCRAAKL